MVTDVTVDGKGLCNGYEGVQKCKRLNEFHKVFATLIFRIAKHHYMIEILLTKEGKLVEEEVSKIKIIIIN
jgi:hypothetical protein